MTLTYGTQTIENVRRIKRCERCGEPIGENLLIVIDAGGMRAFFVPRTEFLILTPRYS